MSQQSIWHYAIGEQKHGPISSQQLKHLAMTGKLSPQDLVWKDGMSGWQPAKIVGGLFAESERSSPPSLPTENAQQVSVDSTEQIVSTKLFWKEWDWGSRLVLISACLALLSMVLPWWERRSSYQFGFMSIGILYSLIFAFPLARVFRGVPVGSGGMTCAMFGYFLAGIFIPASILGMWESDATWGVYLFILSTVILALGVFLNRVDGSIVQYWRNFGGVTTLLILMTFASLIWGSIPRVRSSSVHTTSSYGSSHSYGSSPSSPSRVNQYDLINALKDDTESFKGQTLTLNLVWDSRSPSRRGSGVHIGPFYAHEVKEGGGDIAHLDIRIEINEDEIDVPNLTAFDGCIVTFKCTEGRLTDGNIAVSIRRP